MELYKIDEVNSHKYYKIPKQLFDNVCYRTTLTSDAKLVYAVLLDRMELSRKNNWVNDKGEIFLLYTKKDIAGILGISETTAYKAFKLLDELKLIKQVRQGLNKPNKIFISKINPLFKRNCEICRSRTTECEGQDIENMKSIYTEYSGTELSEKESVYISLPTDGNNFLEIYNYFFERSMGRKHPRVTHDQLNRIYEAIETLKEYSVDEETFKEEVINHLDNLPDSNNGNILAFLQATKRFFDVDLATS